MVKACEIMAMTLAPKPSASGIELMGLLDMKHPLVGLTKSIDWDQFGSVFGGQYHEEGRPGVPIRVMVGLHYLKTLFNESDESVVVKWVENPYWQYLCGCDTFQHEVPCHPTSLVRWRKRVGESGMERLFKAVLDAAMKAEALDPSEIKQVTVDTTVQEKAIAFPTDARLYHKARKAIVRTAKRAGINLRQTYVKAGKNALFQNHRYGAARQYNRARRETRKLQSFLGRVMRDVERKCAQPSDQLKALLANCKRIYTQQRQGSPKLYSVHAPEVECIAKGKANKKYEFGCKVSLTSTTTSNWLVGIQAFHNNPYDGATLIPALQQVQRITGIKPEQSLVDQGYRGTQYHPVGVNVVIVRFTAKVTHDVRRLFKRRSAIEPIIAHTKFDHGMSRNHLLGILGDKINALLTGCGFNLAKLLRFFALPEHQTRVTC